MDTNNWNTYGSEGLVLTPQYCSQCGSKLDVGDIYCIKCGCPVPEPVIGIKTPAIPPDTINPVTRQPVNPELRQPVNPSQKQPATSAPRQPVNPNQRQPAPPASRQPVSPVLDSKKATPSDKPKGLIAKFKALPKPAKVGIISGVIILSLFLIFGFFSILNSAFSLYDRPDEPKSETPPEETPLRVQSVSFLSSGTVILDKVIFVGESTIISVKVEPDNTESEITITNHNPNTIEIEYINQDRSEFTVTGMRPGLARLTASVGGVETACVFRVEQELPPQAETAFITHDGSQVSETEVFVGESIILQLVIEPEDSEDDILLSISNRNVFEAVQSNEDERDIIITGLSSGSATLTVFVGSLRVDCIISVKDNIVPHPYVEALSGFFAGATGHRTAVLVDLDGDGVEEVFAVKQVQSNNFVDYNFAVIGLIGGEAVITTGTGRGDTALPAFSIALGISTTNYIFSFHEENSQWHFGPTIFGYEDGKLVIEAGNKSFIDPEPDGLGEHFLHVDFKTNEILTRENAARLGIELPVGDNRNLKPLRFWLTSPPLYMNYGNVTVTDQTQEILAMTVIANP